MRLDCGTVIKTVFAIQVKEIIVKHENKDITPSLFEVKAEVFNFGCKMTIGDKTQHVKMRGTQFPIISNTCTTGHKLQGCTVASLLANDWFYGVNWEHVVLSRVKTMSGLFIRQRLSLDLSKYVKPQAMKNMLATFASNIAVKELSPEEYKELEATLYVNPPARDETDGTNAPF